MSVEPVRITAPFLDVVEVFVASSAEELHGWAIIKMSQRSGPTVYKILERLADMEWVTARWEDKPSEPNKPRRRYYKLTGVGASRARILLNERRPDRIHVEPRLAFGGGSL
ncbi:PadR family transcriptional regulator [Actinoplanes sp. NPDC049668]|uniref:PadR family transcriptional regulator n=1 Tax=unclassified Actinoplanes TaxID=2626549 RepID=UPI0033AE1DEA